jgi:hypothetical protein
VVKCIPTLSEAGAGTLQGGRAGGKALAARAPVHCGLCADGGRARDCAGTGLRVWIWGNGKRSGVKNGKGQSQQAR